MKYNNIITILVKTIHFTTSLPYFFSFKNTLIANTNIFIQKEFNQNTKMAHKNL